MKKTTRLVAAVLCGALLSGCAAKPAELPPAPETAAMGTIAYVPLDDRPDNLERVAYLAESLGYELAMPELDDYRTRLDQQPLNENGTQFGDRAALYEWVLAQEAAGCDRFVLSLDQLLSGGLVNSRAMAAGVPVVLSDGTVLTEHQLLERLLGTLAVDGDNRVWLLESVMRLAPTVGYEGFGLNEYNVLRSYGMAARPHLSGEALTVETIVADYALGTDGTVLELQAEQPLPAGAVENYLAARERKLRLTDGLMTLLRDTEEGQFRVLIGIDDSSEEDSVQKNEIAYLRGLLRQGDALLSGVDDFAFKAVARLYLDDMGWTGGTAAVQYFGGMEQAQACPYDYQPLDAIVAEHLDFFDLTASADPLAAEMQILVLTQPADETLKATYYGELIETLQDCQKQQRPVILIDAGNGLYGTAFHDALTEKAELGLLLSYAGFLDMAIVTGTAMSHGVARYAFLQAGTADVATETAFAKTLADSILKDFCYKNVVRNELLTYVRGDLAGNADNFWNPDIDREAIQARLEQGMEASTRKALKNLEKSRFLASLAPYGELGWGKVTLSGYRFPWDRAFEISMDITLAPFTT